MFKCYTEVLNGVEVFIPTVQFSALRVVMSLQITTEKYMKGFTVSEVDPVPQNHMSENCETAFHVLVFVHFYTYLHQFVYNHGTPVPGVNFICSYRTS